MATSRVVNTHFWQDTYIIDLDPIEKLLFMYFLTNQNTNLSGIYEISLRQAAFDTGIDTEMIKKILDRFCNDGKMYYQDGWLVLRNFVKHQRINPSIKLGILKSYNGLPDWLREVVQVQDDDNGFNITLAVTKSVNPQSGYSLVQNTENDEINRGQQQTGYRLGTDSPQRKEKKRKEIKRNLIKSKPLEKPELQKISTKAIDELFAKWETIVGYRITSNAKSNRDYAAKLLREYEIDQIERMINGVAAATEDQYAPRIANFIQLYKKWDDLKLWGKRTYTKANNSVLVIGGTHAS